MGRGPSIEGRKNAADAVKAKKFTKFIREITIAARAGGGDPNANPRLRLAIDKAKADNMPKDTIEKAVKKGTGELEGETYEDVLYEGYGPSGVAVMARAMTDNRNRTSGEIRKIFERSGGSLGSPNCVAFQFTSKGVIIVARDQAGEDRMMELALDAGADDVSSTLDFHEITCHPEVFHEVKQRIEQAGVAVQSADIAMVASSSISLDLTAARKVKRLIDALEDQDDVDSVYSNSDLADDVVAALSKE